MPNGGGDIGVMEGCVAVEETSTEPKKKKKKKKKKKADDDADQGGDHDEQKGEGIWNVP